MENFSSKFTNYELECCIVNNGDIDVESLVYKETIKHYGENMDGYHKMPILKALIDIYREISVRFVSIV